jgi:hypothetical protein
VAPELRATCEEQRDVGEQRDVELPPPLPETPPPTPVPPVGPRAPDYTVPQIGFEFEGPRTFTGTEAGSPVP